MRGPIRTPILLPFGNRNTPAEPHRAVPCANKRGQPRHARPIHDRSVPCLPCPFMPRFAEPRRACDDVHRQTFLASPAVPLPIQTVPCLPCLTRRSAPDLALPATPVQATSFLACRSLPS
jgi:hypothetical protein